MSKGIALAAHLEKAIYKRRLEYLAGRYCASRALGHLGLTEPIPIPTNHQRAPVWPQGFTGSITHTKGYAAAIVGALEQWRGLGIDSEVIIDNSRAALIRHVCCPGEFEGLQSQYEIDDQLLFTLVFSAKESLFKALHPIVQFYFGFQAARLISIEPHEGTFSLQLAKGLNAELNENRIFPGYFRQVDSKVITLIMVPRDSNPFANPDKSADSQH